MLIQRLSLTTFRNHEKANFHFKFPITIFIGNNGQGKTNILEAIYMLSTTKSFRGAPDTALAQWNKTSYAIKAIVTKGGQSRSKINIHFNGKEKILTIDNNRISSIKDFYGYVRVIACLPDDINIFSNGPRVRRRFLDSLISKKYFQDTNRYLFELMEYNKIIRNRNHIIKQIRKNSSSKRNLEVYEDFYLTKALYISCIRQQVVMDLRQHYVSFCQKILEQDLDFTIQYSSRLLDEIKNKMGSNIEINERLAKDSKFEMIKQRIVEEDIEKGVSSFGPHRDDVQFFLNKKSIINSASQGQKRIAAISLRMSELEVLKKTNNTGVVFLIDDVLVEMDNHKRKNFLNEILKNEQIIITTTETQNLADIVENYTDQCEFIPIERK